MVKRSEIIAKVRQKIFQKHGKVSMLEYHATKITNEIYAMSKKVRNPVQRDKMILEVVESFDGDFK